MNKNNIFSIYPIGRIYQWTGATNGLAFLLLGISIVSISSAAIFIRICELELSPNSTAFNRLWIATLAFIVLSGIQSLTDKHEPNKNSVNSPQYGFNNVLLIFAMILAISGSLYCWVWSVSRTSVANATLFRNFTPIFTGLGGWLFLGQRFSKKFIVGIVITILGASFLEIPHFQLSSDKLLGDLLALMTAFFYGTYMLLVESLRSKFSTSFILTWRCLLGTAIAGFILFVTGDTYLPHSLQSWLSVIGFAIVCQVIGQGLLAYCLSQFSAIFVSVTHLLEPLFASLMGFLLFSETLGISVAFSFVIIIFGLYLVILSSEAIS